MIITKIEPQKKHKNRSSVFLDNQFAFGINDFDLRKMHLKEGMEIADEQLATIQAEVLAQEAKNYALVLLDRHAYTEYALSRKLENRGYDAASIGYTIAFLKEYGYVNDEDYVRRYISTALKGGKTGMQKIRYDLAGKGIDRAVIATVAAEFEEESFKAEEAALYLLLEKKLKGDFSFENMMKAKRYAYARGFSFETIDSTLQKLKQSDIQD